MEAERKKPGAAFWATVAMVAVLLYVASFGPACWLIATRPAMVMPVKYFYWPLTRFSWMCPRRVAVDPLCNYGLWCLPKNSDGDPMDGILRVGTIFGFGNPRR